MSRSRFSSAAMANGLFFVVFLLTCRAQAQSEEIAIFGPSYAGVCLQLTTKHLGGEKSVNQVTVKLTNRGEKPVVFRTKFVYDKGEEFKEFFEESVFFSSFPETTYPPFSTAGKFRTKPQVEWTLQPGASLTLNRKMSSGYLRGGLETHSVLRMARPGKFFIRANAVLYDKENQPIRLWSNESAVIVGNSNRHPAASTANVLRYLRRKEKNVATLDVGAQDGVQVGDEFVHWSKQSKFSFRVTDVKQRQCKATVVNVRSRGETPVPLPAVGTKVAYEKTQEKE